ncbi:hypothetical protein [Bradyrhizobium sp. AS23.2]|uniref:helix-turn-helix transcriptional regulator n=1 Tax=Bradyrhizobium sp. AS23.2 TaxID=1680155 RepID=UPI0011614EF4|nr:hypothetical protein [Bradyrhizobium sp. AS23.2]
MKQLIRSETVRQKLNMPRSTFERLVKLRTNGFPAPVYISRSRFFNAAEVETWMAGLADRPSRRSMTAVIMPELDITAAPAEHAVTLAAVVEETIEAHGTASRSASPTQPWSPTCSGSTAAG